MGRSRSPGRANAEDHLQRPRRDSVHWRIFKVSNKLLWPTNPSTSVYLTGLLILVLNLSQGTDGLCVWQGGGGFRLACGFRQSGLFRLRSLGGLKGWAGAGFTIGDEDGFKDSLTNTETKPGVPNSVGNLNPNGLQAQASQRQNQYQKFAGGQSQAYSNRNLPPGQQQQSQVLPVTGRQVGHQSQYPGSSIPGSVQKRASLWDSWKWPSILPKKGRGGHLPPPPQQQRMRQQMPPPGRPQRPEPVPYGRIPYNQNPAMRPIPIPVPQNPGSFKQNNNYPQVPDLSPHRLGNAVPNFSPMPEMRPIKAEPSQVEEVKAGQGQRKKPYGLHLLENSKNYGKKFMLKPNIPNPGSESSPRPPSNSNLGYDTNLFPDIYFTTTVGKDYLKKLMEMDTEEEHTTKQNLKKIKLRKKSKGSSSKTSPFPESTTLEISTLKSTKPMTMSTSPITSTSEHATSPRTTQGTSPSSSTQNATPSPSPSPSSPSTTITSTTSKKMTITSEKPQPPTTRGTHAKFNRPTTAPIWNDPTPLGQQKPYQDLDEDDDLPKWVSQSPPPPNPKYSTPEPDPEEEMDWNPPVPIRKDPPISTSQWDLPKSNAHAHADSPFPLPPSRNIPNRKDKERFPAWDYDDEIFYKFETPGKGEGKDEWQGSHSQHHDRIHGNPGSRLKIPAEKPKKPALPFHDPDLDLPAINPGPVYSKGKWKEFYDPRYPPDHEINQGKLNLLRGSLTTSTTTVSPPFFSGNDYFNPKNHFQRNRDRDSTLRTTVSIDGLDEEGKFIKFDSRESHNLLKKTQEYNKQFYNSHFNKSAMVAGAASGKVNSYDYYPQNPPLRTPATAKPTTPTTKRPYVDYPKPAEIEWPWESQKQLEFAYKGLPDPSILIPPKAHLVSDYFDPDIPHLVVSSTPAADRWSGISRKSMTAAGDLHREVDDSLETTNILRKKALSVTNWDPPSFWGPQLDRFSPAADFVTDDNFKIPKFAIEPTKFRKKTTTTLTTEDPELGIDFDRIFSSTMRYNDNDWREYSGPPELDNRIVSESPVMGIGVEGNLRLSVTSTEIPIVHSVMRDGTVMGQSRRVEVVGSETPSSTSSDRRIHKGRRRKPIRKESNVENIGNEPQFPQRSEDYDQGGFGFVNPNGKESLQNLQDEIKQLAQEANSLLLVNSFNAHEFPRNGIEETTFPSPTTQRTTTTEKLEVEVTTEPSPKARPQGGGIVKVTKYKKYKKKKPTTFLPVSGPSTESILKADANIPPGQFRPPPPPDPQMFAYHIPSQSLGPPPTPPDSSVDHLNDFSLGSINQHENMKTEWNLYPMPHLMQHFGQKEHSADIENHANNEQQFSTTMKQPQPVQNPHPQPRPRTPKPPTHSRQQNQHEESSHSSQSQNHNLIPTRSNILLQGHHRREDPTETELPTRMPTPPRNPTPSVDLRVHGAPKVDPIRTSPHPQPQTLLERLNIHPTTAKSVQPNVSSQPDLRPKLPVPNPNENRFPVPTPTNVVQGPTGQRQPIRIEYAPRTTTDQELMPTVEVMRLGSNGNLLPSSMGNLMRDPNAQIVVSPTMENMIRASTGQHINPTIDNFLRGQSHQFITPTMDPQHILRDSNGQMITSTMGNIIRDSTGRIVSMTPPAMRDQNGQLLVPTMTNLIRDSNGRILSPAIPIDNLMRGPQQQHPHLMNYPSQNPGHPGMVSPGMGPPGMMRPLSQHMTPQPYPTPLQHAPSQQPPPRMLQPVRHMHPSVPIPIPSPPTNNRLPSPPVPSPPTNNRPPSPAVPFRSPAMSSTPHSKFNGIGPSPHPEIKYSPTTKKPIPETTKKPLTQKESLRLALETLSNARTDDIESIVNEQFGGDLPLKIGPTPLTSTTSTSTSTSAATTKATTTTTTLRTTKATAPPSPSSEPEIRILTINEAAASSMIPFLERPGLRNITLPPALFQSKTLPGLPENYEVVNFPLEDIALMASGGKESEDDALNKNQMSGPTAQTIEEMIMEALNKVKHATARPTPPPTTTTTATTTTTTATPKTTPATKPPTPMAATLSQMGLLQQNNSNYETIKKLILLNQLDQNLQKLGSDFPDKNILALQQAQQAQQQQQQQKQQQQLQQQQQQIANFNNILNRLKASAQPTIPLPTKPVFPTASTQQNLPFLFSQPSLMTLLGQQQQMNQLIQQNKLNQLQNQFTRPTPPVQLNNPTLLALQQLALKRIQNIQPSPHILLPQQVAPATSASGALSSEPSVDFVDLDAILSLGSSRRSSEVDERPQTRILHVRNAPKSYYPSNVEMNFDPVSKRGIFTDFRCEDQHYFPGLYADPSNSCKVFHLCAKTGSGFMTKTFRCPKETVFDQEVLRCNWGMYVQCSDVEDKYHFNKFLSQSFQFLKTLGEFSASYDAMNGTLAG